MNVRQDGLYVSPPTPWEDWHAGVRMHGHSLHFWRFYPDLTFVKCAREHDFDFWALTESLTVDLRDAANANVGHK